MVLFAGGAALSYKCSVSFDVERRSGPFPPGSTYRPAYNVEVGDQLLLVYVGSSTSFWSNQPGLIDAVEEAKMLLARKANARGWSFQAHGVALEWSTERGIDHLFSLGSFDEVSAGNNWGHSFALQQLWADTSEAPAAPLVLVYRRMFIAPREAGDEMVYAERDRVLVVAKRGLPEIAEWVERIA